MRLRDLRDLESLDDVVVVTRVTNECCVASGLKCLSERKN